MNFKTYLIVDSIQFDPNWFFGWLFFFVVDVCVVLWYQNIMMRLHTETEFSFIENPFLIILLVDCQNACSVQSHYLRRPSACSEKVLYKNDFRHMKCVTVFHIHTRTHTYAILIRLIQSGICFEHFNFFFSVFN